MKPFLKTILLLTLLAGTLDIFSALTHIYFNTGRFHKTIFQGIASGLIGREAAYAGGWATWLLGCFLHYFITFSFILFYFLMYPKLPILSKNKFLSAFALGLLIFTVMNFVVLPLSALPTRGIVLKDALIGLIILSMVIGLPAAMGAERYYGKIARRRPAL